MKYLIVYFLILAETSGIGPKSHDHLGNPEVCHKSDCIVGESWQILYSQNCLESYLLSNNENNFNFIYHASNSIITENNYNVTRANNELILKAGNVIVIKPNSVVQKGSLFLAKIEPCLPCALNFNYPKFFTPNNDNYNDTWEINWENTSEFSRVSIFDRYGKLIKVLNSPSENWNGTLNTKSLSSTDYWFSLEYIDCNGKAEVYKSHFSLIR